MALTREQILAINDSEREEVFIEEWGGSVWVRAFSADEKDFWEKGMQTGNDEATPEQKLSKRYDQLRARTAVLSCCDAQGAPLFVLTDVEWLGRKTAKALDKIWEVVLRINGASKEEQEKLEKKSEEMPSIDSGSSLPLPSADVP